MEEEKRYWDIGFEIEETNRGATQKFYGTEEDALDALNALLIKYGINTWVYLSEGQISERE